MKQITKEWLNFDLLKQVNEIYPDTRYPGDLGFMSAGKPTIIEAKQLYEFAKDIYEKIKKELEKK